MTVKTGLDDQDVGTLIAARIADAWPGAAIAAEPMRLRGGYWASMYRLDLERQPSAVPRSVVLRIAPDGAMAAKELAVQRTIAELGFATPAVRLHGSDDLELGGSWSIMDFAPGTPPLGGINGIAALREARRLLARLPDQLAEPMAALHALDPEPVSAAVELEAPGIAWSVGDLLSHFEASAEALGRADVVAMVQRLLACRPLERATVVCHGDLHPFNLLVDEAGRITVIDWTGAIRADPAFDVAFTSLLLAHPPLDAPRPLRGVIERIGARVARRFVRRYAELNPLADLSDIAWYRAMHGCRVIVEAASLAARLGPEMGGHPFRSLTPAALAAARRVTG